MFFPSLTFKNEENRLYEMIFFYAIVSSGQRGPKYMFMCMCKACKQSNSHLKFLKKSFLNEETWLKQHVEQVTD